MIQDILSRFIDTIPDNRINEFIATPLNMNIVLEGGAFNGSYLAGCLLYLKELEKRNYINIHKLSACSIGTLISLVYFIDELQLIDEIYVIACKQLKKKTNMNIFDKIFKLLRKYITKSVLLNINNKLYITYFNIKTGKQKVVRSYKSVDHLLDVIRRSCSFPYIIDQNLYYKDKYVDGMYPYVFPSSNKYILYLNLHSIHHISGFISIKNEESHMRRIFDGIISIHNFFVYKRQTDICSFVEEWSWKEHIKHFLFISSLNIFMLILHKMYILYNILRKSSNNDKIDLISVFNCLYRYIIKQYCI